MRKFIAWLKAHTFKTPSFWNDRDAWRTKALQSAGRTYGRIVTTRANRPASYTAPFPVICIGNFTMGGSGKTPTVQLAADILKACGKRPAILLRGYGGTAKGPLKIDIQQHSARLVGDEALLHTHIAPTWVSADRVAGAKAIVADGYADCIIMDDGAQNPKLYKDLAIHVIDGGAGLGNQSVFPAGPLREPIDSALQRTDAVIVIGNDTTQIIPFLKRHHASSRKPIMTGWMVVSEDIRPLHGRDVFAFAGIGRPDKFYHTLRAQGLRVVATQDFPDHHPFSISDIKKLVTRSQKMNAQLVTTTKDWVRIPASYQYCVEFLPVSLQVDQIDDLAHLLLSPWHKQS